MSHQVFKEFYLNGAIVYIDLIQSYMEKGKKIEMLDIRLKPRKCYFGMNKMDFLGYILRKRSAFE